MHHGRSFAVPSDSAPRNDHSVEGQDGNPAAPEWYHLPEQSPVPMGRSQVLQSRQDIFTRNQADPSRYQVILPLEMTIR